MGSSFMRAGLVGALLAAAALGCSGESAGPATPSASEPDGASGSVRLQLLPVPGIAVSSVAYKVIGNPNEFDGITPALPEGTLPSPGRDGNLSFRLSLPVGVDYVLSLSANSDALGDDIRCTGASEEFDIEARQTVDFSVTLTCVDYSSGEVIAMVTTESDDCPTIVPKFASAIPAAQEIGDDIATNALAIDSTGKTLGYAWSIDEQFSDVGHFTTATTAAGLFVCDSAGAGVPLTVTFDNGDCDKELHTWVTCAHIRECGNGVFDEGEACDFSLPASAPGGSPAGTDYGCPLDCTVSCSDAVVEPPSEQCNSGGVDNDDCTADCRLRVQHCGDGWITGTEVCDGVRLPPSVPPGSLCSPDCMSIVIEGICGDGIVSAADGPNACDPGQVGGVTVGSATCSNDCRRVASEECVACETNPALSACGPFSTNCLTSPGTSTPPAQAQCYDVQECIRGTNCADGPAAFTACYCGALSTSACNGAPYTGAAAPDGPCRDVIRAAMGDSITNPGGPATNAEVLARFLNRNFAGGAAVSRYNCQKNDPDCRAICGF